MTPTNSHAGRITPILVVGRNRSGTKWLSNILLNHPEIAGIQTEAHCGILETHLFGQIERAVGDLSSVDNYLAFQLLWSETDFFRAAGIEPEFFLTCRPRPTDVFGAFRMLMDEVATRAECRFWLQKIRPSTALDAAARYPDCRFVLIRRDLIGNLESSLELQRRHGDSVSLLKLACGYALDEKIMKTLESSRECVRVSYERLRQRPEAEIERACRELGIQYEPGLLETRFRRNTSFKNSPRKGLSAVETVHAKSANLVASLIPIRFMRLLRRLAKPKPTMHRGMYRELRQQYGID